MEQETLFTAVKWDILKALALHPSSPIELAEKYHTSVSNISQSLRFLELAGLVKSERTSNRDKGQPRVIYSLTGDKAYLVIASKSYSEKKLVNIDERKKIYLRIWLHENESLHYFLEKAIQHLEEDLEEIKGIYLDTKTLSEIKIAVIPKNGKTEYKEITVKKGGETKKIRFATTDMSGIHRGTYYPLHDPQNIIGG